VAGNGDEVGEAGADPEALELRPERPLLVPEHRGLLPQVLPGVVGVALDVQVRVGDVDVVEPGDGREDRLERGAGEVADDARARAERSRGHGVPFCGQTAEAARRRASPSRSATMRMSVTRSAATTARPATWCS